MINQKQNRIYFPIIFLLCWLGFTIYIFIFGPYKYKLVNPFIFYTYLLAVHLALLFGYIRGQRSLGRGSQVKIDYYKFVQLTIIISLTYFVIKLIFTFGGNLRHFSETFQNASKSYKTSSFNHPNLFSYLDMFFAPISLIAITNTLFSYKNLRRRYRYSVFILIMFAIASAIGSATRSGIVQITIISLASFSLGISQSLDILFRNLHMCLIFNLFRFINKYQRRKNS